MTDIRSINEYAGQLRSKYPPQDQFALRIDRCTIRVHANSQELRAKLREYYRAFITETEQADITVIALECPVPQLNVTFEPVPPAPGKTRIKDEFCDFPDGRLLRKRLTDMCFIYGPTETMALGPCLANLNQVINFINNRFVQWQVDRGFLLCHAAGIAKDGRGIAIAGLAGRGKSTLALNLLDHALDFVSNDRTLIRSTESGTAMLGLPKYPRINPGTILNNPRLARMLSPEECRRFKDLSDEELWNLEYKYDVDLDHFFGPERFKLRAQLAAIVVLTWSRTAGAPTVSRVSLPKRPDLLAAIMKSPGIHYYAGPGSAPPVTPPETYLAHFENCPVIEIGGGVDFDHAVETCLELLAGATPA